MAELYLPACPICDAPDSLFRQQRELKGKTYIWYECQVCGSALLSAGDGGWVYQKVGREEKAHLLRQRFTQEELEALLPQPEEKVPVPPILWDTPEEEAPSTPPPWDVAEEEAPSTVPSWAAEEEEEAPEADSSLWEPADDGPPAATPSWAADEEEEELPVATPGRGEMDDEEPALPTEWEAERATPAQRAQLQADSPDPVPSWDVPTVTVSPDEGQPAAPTVTVSEERRYEPNGKTRRRSPASRLFSVLVVLCLIAFLILVGIVAYQLLAGSALFS